MGLMSLGTLQMGSNQPKEFAHYGCRGGLNVHDPAVLVGDEDLTIATDGYLVATGDGLGGFRMRNGMNSWNTHAPPATGMAILARFYQGIKNGSVVTNETHLLLAQIGNTLYSVPQSSAAWPTIGTIGTNANPMTTVRIQNPNDPNFTSGLTDCMVICTGVGGPYVFDGTNLYTPGGWSNASGASWCELVNGIIWFGGMKQFPNQVFGSGDGITASMESLPAIRNFVFSSPVTGLCALGSGANAALIIGLNTGFGILFGTGPSTFYLQEIPFTDSCTAGRTMISVLGVLYFLGHNGEYVFDGMSIPKQVSLKVEPWILNDTYTTGYPMTSNHSLSWSCAYNNKLHIGYCSAMSTPDTILCLDLNVGGWTVLRPNTGIASMVLLDAPADPDPYQCVVGSSTTGKVMQWDFVPTTPGASIYDDAPTNTVPVLATFQTKSFRLGVPGTTKAFQRFYPEFSITGQFAVNFTLNVDSGNQQYQALSQNIAIGSGSAGTWDASVWDVASWSGANFLRFGPPYSRIDFDSIEGSEFAFGVIMANPSCPWVYAGGTGVFSQRSRT